MLDQANTIVGQVIQGRGDLIEGNYIFLAEKLIMLSKQIRVLFGIPLAEAGYYNGQDQLLMSLSGEKPVAFSLLADQLGVRASTVSNMVDRLTEKQLTERLADKTDARKTLVYLTPKGVEAQAEIRRIWEDVAGRIAQNLPAGIEQKQLEDLSSTLAVQLRRLR